MQGKNVTMGQFLHRSKLSVTNVNSTIAFLVSAFP